MIFLDTATAITIGLAGVVVITAVPVFLYSVAKLWLSGFQVPRRGNMQPYFKQPRIVTFLGYIALMTGIIGFLWAIVHMALHLV